MRDFDFCHKQGDGIEATITLRDHETKEPIDLTGCTVKAQIRDSNKALVAEPIIFVDAEGKIEISSGDTSEWKIGRHAWDIRITPPQGQPYSVPPCDNAIWEVEYSATKND